MEGVRRAVRLRVQDWVKQQVAAFLFGVTIATFYCFSVALRMSWRWWARLCLAWWGFLYFPALAVLNIVGLLVLRACSRNMEKVHELLDSLVVAMTAPVLQWLPKREAPISLDELKSELFKAADSIRAKETKAEARWMANLISDPISVASSFLLSLGLRTIMHVIEQRYAVALRKGHRRLSVKTAHFVLTGEVASLVLSPFTASIHFYQALLYAEAAVLFGCPFVLPYLFGALP